MVDTAAVPPLKLPSRRLRSAVFADANANAAGVGVGAGAPIKPKAKAVASRYLAALSKPASIVSRSAAASSATATNTSGRSASPAPRRAASAERGARSPNKTVTAADACAATTRTLSVAFQSPTYCLDTSKVMTRPASPASAPAFPPEKGNSGDAVTYSRASVSERSRNTYRWPASGRDAITRLELEHSASNHKRAALAGGGTPHRASVDGGNEYRMRALWSSEDTSDGASSGADKTPPGSAGQRPSPRSSSARFSRDIAMETCSDRFTFPDKPVSSRTPAAALAASPSPVKKKRSLLNGLLSSSPFSRLSNKQQKQQQEPPSNPVGSSFRITESPSRPRRSVDLPGSLAGKKLQQSKACGLDGDTKKVRSQQKAEEEHQLRLLYTRHLQLRHANAKAAAARSSKRAAAEKTLYAVWMAILRARKSVAIAKLQLQLLRNNCKLMAILRGQMMYLEEWSSLEGVYADSLSGTAEALNATVARIPVSDGAVADVQALKNAIGSAIDVMQSIASSISTQLSKLAQANILVSHLSGVAIQEFVLMARCRELLSTLASMHVKHCSLQGQRIQLNQTRFRRFQKEPLGYLLHFPTEECSW